MEKKEVTGRVARPRTSAIERKVVPWTDAFLGESYRAGQIAFNKLFGGNDYCIQSASLSDRTRAEARAIVEPDDETTVYVDPTIHAPAPVGKGNWFQRPCPDITILQERLG